MQGEKREREREQSSSLYTPMMNRMVACAVFRFQIALTVHLQYGKSKL